MTQPLAIWDASQPGWHGWRHWRAAEKWCRDHGVIDDMPGGSRSHTYRVEIHLIDTPFARAFRYETDEQGHLHWTAAHVTGPHDHDACDVARRQPEDIPLAELPPAHLLAEVA